MRQSGIWYVFESLSVRQSGIWYVFVSMSGVFVSLNVRIGSKLVKSS